MFYNLFIYFSLCTRGNAGLKIKKRLKMSNLTSLKVYVLCEEIFTIYAMTKQKQSSFEEITSEFIAENSQELCQFSCCQKSMAFWTYCFEEGFY